MNGAHLGESYLEETIKKSKMKKEQKGGRKENNNERERKEEKGMSMQLFYRGTGCWSGRGGWMRNGWVAVAVILEIAHFLLFCTLSYTNITAVMGQQNSITK